MKDIIAALFTDSSIRLGKVYKYKISKVSQNMVKSGTFQDFKHIQVGTLQSQNKE